MKVELTIQKMFDEYPTLFKERADCLNHLFCTIGNGYEWINGELVSDKDVTKEKQKMFESRLVNGKAFQYNKLSLKAEAIFYEEKRENNGYYDEFPVGIRKKLKQARIDFINQLPDDVYYDEFPRKKRWYFYTNTLGKERIDYHKEYAELWNYPKNIKKDWLEAIEECKTLLREDGFEV